MTHVLSPADSVETLCTQGDLYFAEKNPRKIPNDIKSIFTEINLIKTLPIFCESYHLLAQPGKNVFEHLGAALTVYSSHYKLNSLATHHLLVRISHICYKCTRKYLQIKTETDLTMAKGPRNL